MAEPRRELVVSTLPAREPAIGRMLWMLDDTRARTKQSLAGVGAKSIDQAPAPLENSIGSLLYHIAVIEADWLYAEVLEQEIPEEVLAYFPLGARDESGNLVVPRGLGLEDYLHVLDQVRALVIETYMSMTIDDFHRPRHLTQYDVTPEWVLHHLMQHEAEHRGHIENLRHAIEAGS